MFYRDYGPLGRAYFEGKTTEETHPAGYSNYSDQNAQRFKSYAGQFCDLLDQTGCDATDSTVLILGCAYGETVRFLREYGVDAWGMDISEFAVNNASDHISSRLIRGNGGSYTDLQSAAEMANVQTFDAICDSGILCYLSDDGAINACRAMRAMSPTVIHRVRTDEDLTGAAEWYNTKSLDRWKQLCDPEDRDTWVPNAVFQQS